MSFLEDRPEEVERYREEIQKKLADTLAPMAEHAERVQSALAAFVEGMAPYLRALLVLQQKFAPVAAAVLESLTRAAPALIELRLAVAELPVRHRKALSSLAQNGWYLDPEMLPSELFDAAADFAAGNESAGNQKLCDHFDGRCTQLETSLCEEFPRRAILIRSAFEAHRRREYGLSIPVLLAQADGVCLDLTGAQLYARQRNGMPQLALEIELDMAPPLLAAILAPILEPAPIIARPSERKVGSEMLYRHAVLHGEATDYDTRVNGCRAISQLVYVTWVLRKAETGGILRSKLSEGPASDAL